MLREFDEPLVESRLDESGLSMAAVRRWWMDGVDRLYNIAQDSC